MRSTLLFITFLFYIVTVDAAEGTQQHQELTQTAKRFLQSHLNDNHSDEILVEVNGLDPRVKLKQCTGTLEAFWPYEPRNLKNVSIGVRCHGSTPWKVYLQGTTKRMRTIAVLNTPVQSGQTLERSMLSMRKLNILDLNRGGITDASKYLGREFSRSVRADTPLSTKILRVPKLVSRSGFVKILSRSGSITVHAEGEALSDGHEGEEIKVRNKTSGKVVQATVTAPGTVVVNH
ncbi:flagella basal body P-ring formation protein FlgA [Chromatiales bacterium (ex Bugula neritina AB1)]|nr:flagella basal body P-ring formation protein FlgA [Chromatiales bacterium (ex Bugula neritina AB1)]